MKFEKLAEDGKARRGRLQFPRVVRGRNASVYAGRYLRHS